MLKEFSARRGIRENLVSAFQLQEGLGISGSRVIGMKARSHHAINPVNGFDVRVAANLKYFVVIFFQFHVKHFSNPPTGVRLSYENEPWGWIS